MITERIQAVLVSFQFVVLIVTNIIALVRLYGGSAGAQAVHPEWSWFSPFGLSASEIAAGVILCIFIYWGWDSCMAVTEETKDADKTPGRAALISMVILLFTYLIVAVAIQAFAGFGDTGIGLANEENSDDVLTIVGEPVLGAVMTSVLLLTVAVGRIFDPDHDSADGTRRVRNGGLRRNSQAFRAHSPALQDTELRHVGDGHHFDHVLRCAHIDQRRRTGRFHCDERQPQRAERAIDEGASAAVLSCANDDEVGGFHARLRGQLPISGLPGGCT